MKEQWILLFSTERFELEELETLYEQGKLKDYFDDYLEKVDYNDTILQILPITTFCSAFNRPHFNPSNWYIFSVDR